MISGSSSAPELKDVLHPIADGCSSTIPSIRPLETLHNSLSLRQLDLFLQRVTSPTFCRLPQNSPMKIPFLSQTTPSGQPMATSKSGNSMVSPNSSFGWQNSGPPSYVSSGPSSPCWSNFDSRYFSEVNLPESESGSVNSSSGPPSPCETKCYNPPSNVDRSIP